MKICPSSLFLPPDLLFLKKTITIIKKKKTLEKTFIKASIAVFQQNSKDLDAHFIDL